MATQYYSEYYLLHKHRNKNKKYALLFICFLTKIFPNYFLSFLVGFLLSAHMESFFPAVLILPSLNRFKKIPLIELPILKEYPWALASNCCHDATFCRCRVVPRKDGEHPLPLKASTFWNNSYEIPSRFFSIVCEGINLFFFHGWHTTLHKNGMIQPL